MDRYKVLKRIGVGTYGSAYLVCLKTDPLAQFVLKKIKIDEGNDKERQQAETEVAVLRSLDHPLVLGYVDHFNYKGHLCIVTDYCEGGDLYQWLRARKTPMLEPQILEWMVQTAMAIQYVHSKNILHRDLKTQNIFITKDGYVKLGDFGISRALNHTMDLASTLIGTPYYMSPEVISSQPYDFKSDMWSLGCCVYEMMCLKHAFDAGDMSALVMKILRGEHLPIPSNFSADLRDLVKSLLAKNPRLRLSADQLLKLPWLREYAARARDKVAWLEQHRSPYRFRSTSSITTTSEQPAQSGSNSRHPSNMSSNRRQSAEGGPGGQADLDRELQVARERLRRIQEEREVIRGQAQARDSGTISGTSRNNSPPRRPPLPSAAVPVAGAAGAGGGASGWDKDRADRLQRLASNRHVQVAPQLLSSSDDIVPPAYGNGGGAPGGAPGGGGGYGRLSLAGPTSGNAAGGGAYPSYSRASAGGLGSSPPGSDAVGADGEYGGGGGISSIDAALARHREARHARHSSRDQSPNRSGDIAGLDYGAGGSMYGGGAGNGTGPLLGHGGYGHNHGHHHHHHNHNHHSHGGGSYAPSSQSGMQQQQRQQQQGYGGGAASGSDTLTDIKARKEARKAEEIRRREAELLEARKAYFEERKYAEHKKWHMLHGVSSSNPNTASAASFAAASANTASAAINGMNLSAAVAATAAAAGRAAAAAAAGGRLWGGPSGGHQVVCDPGDLSALSLLDSSDDELEAELQYQAQPLHQQYDWAAAQQEFEEELRAYNNQAARAPAPAQPQLLHTLDAGSSLPERASALRDFCVANLGPALFDLIYGNMRKRQGQFGDPALFRQELLSRLGPERMQYVGLVDQLLYYEELMGL